MTHSNLALNFISKLEMHTETFISRCKFCYLLLHLLTKPTSSFEGITDELEFANFDNNLDLNL
jgi:hypothetical protein